MCFTFTNLVEMQDFVSMWFPQNQYTLSNLEQQSLHIQTVSSLILIKLIRNILFALIFRINSTCVASAKMENTHVIRVIAFRRNFI